MFSIFALVATACPKACAGAHADPPIEQFEEAWCFCCVEVAECVGLTLQHDPRPRAHGDVDADGLLVEQTSRTAAWSGSGGCRWFGRFARKKLHSSVGRDDARFGGQFANLVERCRMCEGMWSKNLGRRVGGRPCCMARVAALYTCSLCSVRQLLCVKVPTDSMKEFSPCDVGGASGWGWRRLNHSVRQEWM